MAAIEGELLMNSYFEKLIKRLYEQHRHYENALQGSSKWNARFRVTTDIGTTVYVLDRWD